MEKNRDMEYEEEMLMKTMRGPSRTKGKNIYDRDKTERTGKSKSKQRNAKNIIYDPNFDYDNYEEYDEY
jgi:hypothetical protein